MNFIFWVWGQRTKLPACWDFIFKPSPGFRRTLHLAVSTIVLSPETINYSQTPDHERIIASLLSKFSLFRSPRFCPIHNLWIQLGAATQTTSPAFPLSAWKKQLAQLIGVEKIMSQRAELCQQEKRTRQNTQKWTPLFACPSCLPGHPESGPSPLIHRVAAASAAPSFTFSLPLAAPELHLPPGLLAGWSQASHQEEPKIKTQLLNLLHIPQV